jgi:hypothetical protein
MPIESGRELRGLQLRETWISSGSKALRKSDAPDQAEPKMECRDSKHIFANLLPAQMAEQTESPYFGQITSPHI